MVWDGRTVAEVDPVLNILGVIEAEHFEIHEGDHFFVSDYDADVDTNAPKYWLAVSPNTSKRMHITFVMKSSRNGLVEVFVNPLITDNGTGLVELNNNADSTNTPQLRTFADPTVGGDGTRIYVEVMGTDGTNPIGDAGGISERKRELILMPNAEYLLKYTTLTNDNRVSMLVEWYEV